MNHSWTTVRLPSGDESIAPVMILDALGRIVRVVSAEEFRRERLAAIADMLADPSRVVPMRTKRALHRARGQSRRVSGPARVLHRAMAS